MPTPWVRVGARHRCHDADVQAATEGNSGMSIVSKPRDVAMPAGAGQRFGAIAPGAQPAARDMIQRQARHFRALRESGLDGRAVIVEIVDTGDAVAGNPVQEFHLDLTLDARPAERVVHREIVSSAAVGKYPMGEPKNVKVNPHDHGDLTFAW
jgi:hypothetical protein